MKKLEYYQSEPAIFEKVIPNVEFGFDLDGRSPFSEVMIKFDSECFGAAKASRQREEHLELYVTVESSKSFADQGNDCSGLTDCKCQECL